MVRRLVHSPSSNDVIRKPDSTKKTSMVRKPPLATGAPPWYSMSPRTDTARSPSRAGTKLNAMGRPRDTGPTSREVTDRLVAAWAPGLIGSGASRYAGRVRPLVGRRTNSPMIADERAAPVAVHDGVLHNPGPAEPSLLSRSGLGEPSSRPWMWPAGSAGPDHTVGL